MWLDNFMKRASRWLEVERKKTTLNVVMNPVFLEWLLRKMDFKSIKMSNILT